MARWFELAFSNGVPRRSLRVMLIVGPILTLINQGDRIINEGSVDWLKLVLTFIVPYVVATLGAVGSMMSSENPPSSNQTDNSTPPAKSGGQSVQARVHVTLKNGVLDPQGKAIENALSSLGFAGVESVRQGKIIELTLAEQDEEQARQQLEEMCEKLLANTVIENYAIELLP